MRGKITKKRRINAKKKSNKPDKIVLCNSNYGGETKKL
jgi:hypothetical protein